MGMGLDGGMAEEILVPERCLVPLARDLAVRNACLVEPLSVVLHGLRIAGLSAGHRVAVVGAGTIGLCAVAGAVTAGAEVHLEARYDVQRRAGEQLGARESTGPFDLVVDCAGSPSALARAVALCRPGGRMLLLATYWNGMEIPGIPLCMKEIQVVPSSLYSRVGLERDFERAAGLLAARPEIADALITHRYPLEGAVEAFETAADRASGAIKVVLDIA